MTSGTQDRVRDEHPVRTSPTYRVLVRVGLCGYGLIHLVTAGLALAVAFGADTRASQFGALRALAERPLGFVLLIAVGVGMLTCAFWQVVEATVGRLGAARLKWHRRVADIGRAAVYAVLGVLALATAGEPAEAEAYESPVTAQLLAHPAGAVLVAAVGVGVGAFGVAQVFRGSGRRFRQDLSGSAGHPTVVFGIIGFCAKGLVYLVLGFLILVAALTRDVSGVGGMDVALARLRELPFGGELLAAMAGGIACFGLYCFAWARRARV